MEIKKQKKANLKIFTGVVFSNSMDKTINVVVESRKLHRKYKKYYKSTKKYHVRDEKGMAKAGDKVTFMGCRPLSKTVRWRLLQVIK
ncbi:MAG: 30S ribosomal protein S17 [bacterium]